ncbi:MAG: GNAT family N-acetyltransferase [Parcubacteria group bacterium]|nr:GNAT family N-acetyltransferase [Parcubacteria group bacterium]
MIIRKFRQKDAQKVCKLICRVFNKFVAPDFTRQGIKKWLGEQTPKQQIERARQRDIYVAIVNNKIVGMIEGRREKNDGRVTRLFVDRNFHKKGIARNLMNKIETLYKKKKVKKMKIFSSLYAQDFYGRMDYKKTTGTIKNKKWGMVYQPMKKIFKM